MPKRNRLFTEKTYHTWLKEERGKGTEAADGEGLRAGEAAIRLPRGEVLRGGDRLCSPEGLIVEVCAADETLSHVSSADPFALARAAYHLGNRHVPVQVGQGWLRYQHDHVLDHMVQGLGLEVSCLSAPFEPESGAYAGHHHGHAHDHDH